MTVGVDLASFRDVDASANPQLLIGFLEQAKRQPTLVALQAELVGELRLGASSRVLDLGCGFGGESVEIARQVPGVSVMGVDASAVMIDEAVRRFAGSGAAVSFQVADAAALPFPDDGFDACQAQTLLEHVAEPAAVIAEMVRVTRPGGRVGALDIDQGSTFLDHPDPATTRTIVEAWTDGFAGGRNARALGRLFRAAGLEEVTMTMHSSPAPAGFLRPLLAPTAARLQRDGVLSEHLVAQWWAGFDQVAAGGGFFGSSAWFLATGTLPG